MDAPLELQDEVLQLDARQFNYRVVHRYCTLVLGGLTSYNEKIKFGEVRRIFDFCETSDLF